MVIDPGLRLVAQICAFTVAVSVGFSTLGSTLILNILVKEVSVLTPVQVLVTTLVSIVYVYTELMRRLIQIVWVMVLAG